MIISQYNQHLLSDITAEFDITSAAPPTTDPMHHDWKSSKRILAELVVIDSFKTLHFTEPWQATVDSLQASLLAEENSMSQKIVVCGEETNPDHVVQLVATTKNKRFKSPTGGSWLCYAVPAVGPHRRDTTSSSSRNCGSIVPLVLLARSRCDLSRSLLQNLQVLSEKNRVDSDIYRAYAQLPPFAVSFDQVDISFAGSSVPQVSSCFRSMLRVMGLCVNPESRPFEQDELGPREGPPRIVLQPVHAPCVGMGIIRALDAENANYSS
ncbi:unnamed protein product [Peronospora destructor]|uniref:Uncharacterized protein n=1 Tax=Peronospora destructor TaxID=86335 RepID=A0AAV0V7H1_9STRA|nr:unnamed protein product [Peronospora destructor]